MAHLSPLSNQPSITICHYSLDWSMRGHVSAVISLYGSLWLVQQAGSDCHVTPVITWSKTRFESHLSGSMKYRLKFNSIPWPHDFLRGHMTFWEPHSECHFLSRASLWIPHPVTLSYYCADFASSSTRGLWSSGMAEIFMNFDEEYLVLIAVSFPAPARVTRVAILDITGSKVDSE